MDDSHPLQDSPSIESHHESGDFWVPKIGMEFDTVEDAWQFWMKYGARVGFDVRRQWLNKDKKDGKVSSARFVCNKEGHRKKDKRDHLTKQSRAETRTNCLARMGVSYKNETGRYRLHDLVYEHNHPLHLSETIHMMTSQRKILEVQAAQIDMAYESGIQSKATYELMSRQCGGRSNIGYTLVDQKNYLRSKRQRDLIYGEAGSLLRYFQQQAIDNPSFYSAVQLDSEEQITNIFWADAKMLIDYAYFGDLVTFDTTYRTNKEFRPFGVFVGLNHHRQIIIFGATLLYDETSESFEWLFATFLEAHKNKKPKCIFTDQDHAMASALLKVMPDIYHGLCTWHIMQNAIKHLGPLLKDGSNILKDFKSCMYEYEEEDKFQLAWNQMVSQHHLEENSWLKNIYKVKEKWAKCYMNNVYTLGVRSTQLSESLNGDLKDYLKSDLNIIQFFKHFERVVEDKRYNELKAEYDSRQKLPKMRVRKSPLLQQVGKIYTPAIFELFHDEYDWSLAAFIKDRKEGQNVNQYLVAIYDHEEEYEVQGNISEKMVSCSCKKFETHGFLCCHALKVLDVMDIKLIPEQYIAKRWTRKAKSENIEDASGRTIQGDMKLDNTQRYRFLCSKLVKLASRASENEESYLMLDKAIDELTTKITSLNMEHSVSDGVDQGNCSSLADNEKNIELQNLSEQVKGLKKKTGQKGRKRLKSWVEKQKWKKKKKKVNDAPISNAQTNLSEGSLETNSTFWMNNNTIAATERSELSFCPINIQTHPNQGIIGGIVQSGGSSMYNGFSELLMAMNSGNRAQAMDSENQVSTSNYVQFSQNSNNM